MIANINETGDFVKVVSFSKPLVTDGYRPAVHTFGGDLRQSSVIHTREK